MPNPPFQKSRTRLISATVLALVALALTAGPKRADAQEQEKFRNVYRARLVDMSSRQSSLAGMADFIVTRWSSQAERTMLLKTLSEKGHDAFIKALRMREETGHLSPQTNRLRDTPARASAMPTSLILRTGAKRS